MKWLFPLWPTDVPPTELFCSRIRVTDTEDLENFEDEVG